MIRSLDTSFIIQEFVPRKVYEYWGDRSLWFVNPKMILFCQWLKDQSGSIVTVNDWCFGGSYQYSGFRPFDCMIGARFSQHRLGNAIDIKVKGWEAEQVRDFIRRYFLYLNQEFYLSTIEKATPTWVHVDFRYTGLRELLEVNYK